MALHNIQDKWLYLMEPHTASRATVAALQQVDGSQIGGHHARISNLTGRDRKHIRDISVYDIIACTVRNPFDVLVTRWRIGSGRNDPFHEWAWKNRDHIVVSEPLHGLWKDANSWLYYEHLSSDLNYVFGQELDLGYDDNHKTDSKEGWSDYYDQDGGEVWDYVMEHHYSGFCQMFGYSFHKNEDGKRICSIDPTSRKKLTRRIRRVRGNNPA